MWCYAGLKKLEELQSQSGSMDNSGDTLLFGFAAVGTDWKLHFAYNEEGGGVVSTSYCICALRTNIASLIDGARTL